MTTPEEIIAQYSTLVMNLAWSRVSYSDADDVYQEVFYRYIDKEPRFRDEQHAKAWFIRVTCNIINSIPPRGRKAPSLPARKRIRITLQRYKIQSPDFTRYHTKSGDVSVDWEKITAGRSGCRARCRWD